MVYQNYIIIIVIIIFGLKYYYIYLIPKNPKIIGYKNPVFLYFWSSSRQRKITLKTVLEIPSVRSQLGGLRRGRDHDRLRLGSTADHTIRC